MLYNDRAAFILQQLQLKTGLHLFCSSYSLKVRLK